MTNLFLFIGIFVVLYLIRVGAYRVFLNAKEHRLLHEKKFVLYVSKHSTATYGNFIPENSLPNPKVKIFQDSLKLSKVIIKI